MALNYEEKAAKVQGRIAGLMTEVYRINGLPMARDQSAGLIMAGAWLGVTGKCISQSSEINKRKELIHEFNEQRRIIENALRGIELGTQRGIEDQPGIRMAANMP